MPNPSLAHARTPSCKSVISALALSVGLLLCGTSTAQAQVPTFGGNAQHTNVYAPPAQNMNRIRWTTSIDSSNTGAFAHYGAPLMTANNTVITPEVISSTNVQVKGLDGLDGTLKYTLSTDWTFPAHGWIPAYQPCLVGNRLYYAGAGGTIYYVDNADTTTPSAPTQVAFYGDLSVYQNDKANFDSTVFVNTPITADSAGNIYFGFRMNGSAPDPLNTSQGGYAKITPAGVATYVLAGSMIAGDANPTRDCHNTAPALSNDESKLYVVIKWEADAYYGYLVALNTSDMTTSSSVFLKDPRNGNNAGVLDDGTASPVVAPDGDVYLGVFANPYNGSRGFLSHYSGDLSEAKTFGGFGWDYTPGIVPASMVPSYQGTSSYLIFCKYNNYTGTGVDDGDGVNRVAVLDPNAVQTDAHASSNGLQIMREVLTSIGNTPDEENPGIPIAVREMCVNATCVNPATNSVFFNSEDGRAYRWDLSVNQVTQSLVLTPGFGAPYIPSVIGPDGTVYTLNGGNLFAMGNADNDTITLASTHPDSRTALPTDSITFTAHVNAVVTGVTNTGSHTNGISIDNVAFWDFYYDGATTHNNLLGVVAIDPSGNAAITTTLTAGGTQLGNHFITAEYTGNLTLSPASVTLVQKVHAFATSTDLQAVGNPSPYGQPVVLTATVTGVGTTDIPTGQVTFLNDNKVIGQVPVDGTGVCTFTAENLPAGTRDLQAYYQSDTFFASSSSIQEVTITEGTTMTVDSSPNPSTYGQSVTFTASVSPADAGAGVPTGSVVFTIDGSAGAPVAVDSTGVATYNTSSLAVGTHTVSADFTGSNGWGNSNANGSDHNVTDGTTTVVGSSPNPSTVGDSVTFTATVTSADAGAGTPTGSVVFTIDGVDGAPIAVNGSGVASFSTNTLTQGSHTVAAAFTGTGGYGNSNDTGDDQVVNASSNDTTAPTVPQGVHVTPGPGKNKVTVSWSASTDIGGSGVDHYEVWRSNKPNNGFSLTATVTTLNLVDNIGNKQTRYYYVIAVDVAGNKSAPSAIAGGTAPAIQTAGNGKNGD